MSNEARYVPKCESVMGTESTENPDSFEDTIKPSEEFLQIFISSCAFSRNPSKFSKNEVKTVETKIKKLSHKTINGKSTKFDDTVTLASACKNMCDAYILSHNREKLPVAKDFILNCLNLIKNEEVNPKCILLALKAYSHLADIYSKQKQIEKATAAYDQAVDLYLRYVKKYDKRVNILDLEEVIAKQSAKLNGFKKLTKIYLTILQSSIELNSRGTSTKKHSVIRHRHLLLRIQYRKLPETQEYYKWIESAMALCDYFLTRELYREARNHIAAAGFVKKIFLDDELFSVTKENFGDKQLSAEAANLCQQCSSVYLIISMRRVRYELLLWRKSIERLLYLTKGEELESSLELDWQKLLIFPNFERMLMTNSIKMKYVSNYRSAKKVFTVVLNILCDAKLVYINPDQDIETYMKIVLYTAKAYKYMMLYERDAVNRISLQNQCVDFLSSQIELINKKHRNILRYLQLQLAITCSFLIDTKIEHLGTTNLYATRHNIGTIEIDILLTKSLKCLKYYMRPE